ncbi:MAG: efflux RND transporter periplasmic adaptor subunit, partial [Desulfoferrobacter sp.]
ENKAKAELARINLGYTRITAPFDGRMERHLVDPGNLVGASGPSKLVTIYRLNPIFAYFNVNEYDLTRLIRKVREEKASTYQPGKISVFLGTEGEADYPHKGTLDYASAALDQTTGSLQLRATFPNPMINHVPALLPGMYARVRIPIEVRKNALLIPEDALGITQGQRFLLTVNDQNVVEQHSVTVGKKVKDLRVVEEGLKSTDWVIVTGVQFAHPGSKVTPVRKKVPDDATD